jgi:acetyl esterase/lipase
MARKAVSRPESRFTSAFSHPGVQNGAVAPSWFFVVSIIGLGFTVNALKPVHRPVFLVGFSFFSAWLTTELAVFHLAWQIAVTALFVHAGVLGSWPGRIGLALTCVSWLGLVSMVAVALRTGAVMDAALREALVGGYDDEDTKERSVPWGRVLWPNPRRRGVQRIRNLAYVDDGMRRHRLDIYRPQPSTNGDAVTGAPVLLQIHGGAWMIGSKEQQGLPLMYQLAQHGWVCVAINYRLSPRATWPDHLVDCKRALAWVKEHVAEYGGDPDRVVVTGGSAGGHLTAMMGLTANDARFQPGFETADTSVRAFVPIYAVYDFTDREGIRGRRDPLRRALERHIVKRVREEEFAIFDLASPMSHVREGVPPCFVVHGALDTLAPVEEARHFVGLLRAVSTEPVAYAELPGAHHAFDVFASIRCLLAVDRIERFATWAVKQNVATAVAGAADDADARANDPTTTARTGPSPARPA